MEKTAFIVAGPEITPELWQTFKKGILTIDSQDSGILYPAIITLDDQTIDAIFCTESSYPLDLYASAISSIQPKESEEQWRWGTPLITTLSSRVITCDEHFWLVIHPGVLDWLEELRTTNFYGDPNPPEELGSALSLILDNSILAQQK